MRLMYLAASTALLSSACAGVATGAYGHALDAHGRAIASEQTPVGLKISAREVEDYASEFFGYIAITIENDSSEWVRIARMQVRFPTRAQNEGVLIPWGRDVMSWARAAGLRHEIRQTNTMLILTGVGMLGAVVAGSSQSMAGEVTGGAVAAGALTAAAIEQAGDEAMHRNTPAPFPREHVMSVPLAVPPGLFSRHWLLLNTPGDLECVTGLVLEYETDRGQRERVLLYIRDKNGHSEWQRPACKAAEKAARRASKAK
jgi:hypothetical protein